METEQPKSIEEIEKKIINIYDIEKEYNKLRFDKYYKWQIDNIYNSKTDDEKKELDQKFDATCIEYQKWYIWLDIIYICIR
ncbi:hypothetical protein [Spiroplasma endosymbiont of Atherix ibis]|uniref:hypothetical protein n=1 Tax=Spiroplasma endosymbiont of Atherix ibis TaxID=3066291 RepID=UPI0030D132E8